jgi:photosystem II stability/assembly factor-like uncharacterized protein
MGILVCCIIVGGCANPTVELTQPSTDIPSPAETSTRVPESSQPSDIQFFSERANLQAGECTMLHWEVFADANVMLNDKRVDRVGQKEVCPSETQKYDLAVGTGTSMDMREVIIFVATVEGMEKPDVAEQPGVIEPGIPAYLSSTWVSTGGPPGGLGYDIRMDPRDPDVMYVTDAWAGVFKSLDGGINWFPINNGITARTGPSGDAIPVFSLTIDPNNPDTIWAGTQFGAGAFRSDNEGQNWTRMSNGIQETSLSIRGFTIEPGNSDVVYLAGEISSWEWNGQPTSGLGLDMTRGAVYKTVNGGVVWERIWYGDNLARYIWINPQNKDLIYVSTGIFDREAANSNAGAGEPGGVGILRSQDGGLTWDVLAEQNGIRPDELYFGSLFMHPQNPNVLIAAAGNDPYQMLFSHPLGAIYLTEDGGDSWQRVLELSNASTVEICTGNPDVMYAGSINGVYRSMDGGHTWMQVAGSLWGSVDVLAGFPIDMQCDPRDPMRIFINNYIGGNFLSQDGGLTWIVSSKGYTGALLSQIASYPSDPRIVYVSTRMGIFVSHDGGDTWQGTAYGPARVPEGTVVAVSPYDSNEVMAVLMDGGPDPKGSMDGGLTWQNIDTGLWTPEHFPTGSITRVVFSPYDPNMLVATAGMIKCYEAREKCETIAGMGIIRSTDRGDTWTGTSLEDAHVFDVRFASESLLYAAAFPATVYRSTDGGLNWEMLAQNISDPIPGTFIDINFPKPIIVSIAVDPFNHDILYAGFERGGIMISQDGGSTWQHSSAGMAPETSIVDIEVDYQHLGLVYLASPNSGVFYSLDSGATWTLLNDGLVTRMAVDLSLSADGSLLYLATNGGGVWRLGSLGD